MQKDKPISDILKGGSAPPNYIEDHHALNVILGRVLGTRDLDLLVPLLGELQRLLEEHFSREEHDDGLFQMVRDRAPQHMEQIEALQAEHPLFLAAVRDLEKKTRACIDGPVNEIMTGISKLCQDLQVHETRENGVLSDALYRDLGEAG